MKILVIGASQGVGAMVIQEGLAKGHEMTAFSRNPQKLAMEHPRLRKIQGDFHDPAALDQAVQGQDQVIVTAAPGSLKAYKDEPDFHSRGTGLVIQAMKKHKLRRLIVLSSLGTGESRSLLPFFLRILLLDFILKAPIKDHEREEALVRDSGLDWVIVRPSGLRNGPGHKNYKRTSALEAVPTSIARADVADFIISAAESDQWLRQSVQLGG